MKIGMLGAGGMGSFVGSFLQKGGADLWLMDTYEAHISKIKENGLTVNTTRLLGSEPEKTEVISINATTNPEEIGVCDLVIVLTKGYSTDEAILGASSMFDDHTYVLTLQNGLGNEEKLLEHFPKERVGHGILQMGGTVVEPGIINGLLNMENSIYFCSSIENVKPPILAELEYCLNQTEAKAKYSYDVDEMVWKKLIINGSTSLICAITGLKAGQLIEIPEGLDLVKGLVKEIVEVAVAKGINFDLDKIWEEHYNSTLPRLAGSYPSAAWDIYHNRLTEVDNLNDAVSKIGRKYNISTPVNDTLVKIIKVIENTYDLKLK